MEQAVKAALEAGGMEVDATLARFGGNEALLLKYLRRFPGDPSFAALEDALPCGNGEALRTACHTLKGVSGTLGLMPLYNAASDMMAALRANEDATIPAHFAAVKAAHAQAMALVAQLGNI